MVYCKAVTISNVNHLKTMMIHFGQRATKLSGYFRMYVSNYFKSIWICNLYTQRGSENDSHLRKKKLLSTYLFCQSPRKKMYVLRKFGRMFVSIHVPM